jgi:hypothetical protein
MPDSIILLGPIEVNPGVFKCVNHEDEGAPANYNFTDPIFTGMASDSPKFGLSGDDTFNIYRADSTAPTYANSPRVTGGIKFGVTPCAEKIDITIKGAADIYGDGFDTLSVVVDGTTIGSFASQDTGATGPPFGGTYAINSSLTHNFTTPSVCGHIVEISGESGDVYNNGVGYDARIVVTLRTTQLPT